MAKSPWRKWLAKISLLDRFAYSMFGGVICVVITALAIAAPELRVLKIPMATLTGLCLTVTGITYTALNNSESRRYQVATELRSSRRHVTETLISWTTGKTAPNPAFRGNLVKIRNQTLSEVEKKVTTEILDLLNNEGAQPLEFLSPEVAREFLSRLVATYYP